MPRKPGVSNVRVTAPRANSAAGEAADPSGPAAVPPSVRLSQRKFLLPYRRCARRARPPGRLRAASGPPPGRLPGSLRACHPRLSQPFCARARRIEQIFEQSKDPAAGGRRAPGYHPWQRTRHGPARSESWRVMDGGDCAPREVDTRTPNVARMYDYFLGGKDNFAADRAAAEQIIALAPGVPAAARRNRAFLRRAARFLVGVGIRQFVDIGAGLPTQRNVHEIAHLL